MSASDLQQAVEYLVREDNPHAIWVFGSVARGEARPDSDVDFAVLFRKPPTLDLVQERRSNLTAILRRDVDLVDVRTASPILQMQILKNGQLLFEGDAPMRVRFEQTVPSRYEDLKLIRRSAEAALLRRLKHGS